MSFILKVQTCMSSRFSKNEQSLVVLWRQLHRNFFRCLCFYFTRSKMLKCKRYLRGKWSIIEGKFFRKQYCCSFWCYSLSLSPWSNNDQWDIFLNCDFKLLIFLNTIFLLIINLYCNLRYFLLGSSEIEVLH